MQPSMLAYAAESKNFTKANTDTHLLKSAFDSVLFELQNLSKGSNSGVFQHYHEWHK